ncbi:PREDICTED: protein anachronism isoform X1 [Drosophila arizonae]|uniref:Protein anachronism isoform X1 n=1 Tax=Drosophila arizonae TaxID=7263 RepID=A0ABM1PKF8_DROAR|nr:PREDICTED: protein anachronism isoform X1 [Drosophila arizonae]
MSSIVLCGRRLLLLLLFLQLLMMSCDAARINRSAFMDGDVRSEVVDPNNRTIWGMFNLTEEQVNRIRSGSNPAAKDEATQANKNHLLDQIARQRINEIRSRIRIAVTKSDVNDSQAEQAELNQPSHEKAGYPICNSETTPSNWQQSSNVTLEFASSVFQQYGNNNLILDSAILRLYKINPADKTTAAPATAASGSGNVEPMPATTPSCREPYLESQIRVTVYIVHQQKKKRKLERKKRTCNTIMLSSTKTGWVDIDVKCALTYWAQQQQQQQQQQQHPTQHSHLPIEVGLLMIEVHDDEDNQLLPGLYFQPPTCVQADIAVPWSVYGPATPMPNMENNTLSRCPRLDVRFLGNGLLTEKSFENRTNGKLENLKSQVLNPSRSREHLNAEATTLNSPTIDNNLENSENESEQREQIHHHRRRHHHQSVECASMEAEESFQQSAETQHHLRTHHNHHHHHHHRHHQSHNHHHHQHKHRHVVQNEE